ncbi:MAG: type II toxin-antitoxin system VapC family toxin [Phycisphaeraceae bacterium]
MVTRTESYVDTSALIAFMDESDTYHLLFKRLFSAPPPLVTSPLVVAEGHGWFLRRYDRSRAMEFLGLIEQLKPLRVLSLTARLQAAATHLVRRFSDQDLTLADALGLHLMEDREITSCWSTDSHLGLTGVPLVIHQT